MIIDIDTNTDVKKKKDILIGPIPMIIVLLDCISEYMLIYTVLYTPYELGMTNFSQSWGCSSADFKHNGLHR